MMALVLHSGGLDSTTCLLLAREEGRDVVSLGIDYRQRHSIELTYAALQAERWAIPRKVIQVSWDKPDRAIPLDRTLEEMRSGSSAFLPGRNLVFLALAAAEAATVGAEEIWIGVNAVDFSGYPDCRPDFLKAFGETLGLAIPDCAAVRAPLLALTKPEIAAEAARLGMGQGDTWSCYRPQVSEVGVTACGRCDACVLHSHAWRDLVEQ